MHLVSHYSASNATFPSFTRGTINPIISVFSFLPNICIAKFLSKNILFSRIQKMAFDIFQILSVNILLITVEFDCISRKFPGSVVTGAVPRGSMYCTKNVFGIKHCLNSHLAWRRRVYTVGPESLKAYIHLEISVTRAPHVPQ